MNSWYKSVGIFMIAAMLTLAIAGQVAFAQGNGPNPGDRPGRPGQQQGHDGQRPDDPLRGIIDHAAIKSVIADTLGLTVADLDAAREAGTTLEALAEQQGVAIEDVQTAAKAAALSQIEEAVVNQELTQEQADTLIERINNSDFPLGGRGHGPHDGGPGGRPDNGLRGIIDHEAIKSVIADALGLTVADLDAAHEAGTTLETLAEQQGVALEDVKTAVKAAALAQIEEAVANEEITQAQADTLIERINNSDFPLGGRGHGPHDGGPGGRPDDGLRGIIDHEAIKSVIADVLGLTVADLDAAHEAGTTLEALAEQQGIALEDVQAAAKTAALAQIEEAVANQEITQEQADVLIERINNSDFPLHGPRPHGNHDISSDNSDPAETNDSTVTADAENAATQRDSTTAVTVFLPIVTR